jgi:hypothetical protein
VIDEEVVVFPLFLKVLLEFSAYKCVYDSFITKTGNTMKYHKTQGNTLPKHEISGNTCK